MNRIKSLALMSSKLDPQAVAREPLQQRAKDRFEQILQEAEALLLKEGLSGFSIPVLAERLGFTRGSVYAYFPTPYAIFNELAKRYLTELAAIFHDRAGELVHLSWRDAVRTVVDHAVQFHNSKPVARLLLLGGAVTDESYRAQEMTIKQLGDLARQAWERGGIQLPHAPDVPTLATDIATACFRRSFFIHGKITPQYRDAAVQAMTSFIANYVEEGAAPVVQKKIAR